jgi:hypothetical protein
LGHLTLVVLEPAPVVTVRSWSASAWLFPLLIGACATAPYSPPNIPPADARPAFELLPLVAGAGGPGRTVRLGTALYGAPAACLCARLAGGADEGRMAGGDSEGRLTGGANEGRLAGGDSEGRLTGGANEGRLAGGDSEGRLTGGANEGRLAGGDSEGRMTGGANEGRLAGGDSEGRLSSGGSEGRLAAGDSEGRLAGGASNTPMCRTNNALCGLILLADGTALRTE